ncbi:MAG: DUF5069 domain-containing protein [Chthoniobacterales bacterium]
MSATLTHADLTQRPPRSPRARLGGYVILPRMLDKGRATLAGKNGLYHYACPLDQRFLSFAGIDPEKLKEQLALDKGDGEILEWISENSTTKPKEWEIVQWSSWIEQRTPGDVETKEYFTGMVAALSKTREDILTWGDLLDLDDYVTFGGKA